jgi:acetyl esterase
MRRMMQDFIALGVPSESVSKVTNFGIPGPAGEIPIRLYVPLSKAVSPITMPVLVYYHGGGFVSLDLESSDTFLRAIANRAGCIVVSVAYHLAPENPYPVRG